MLDKHEVPGSNPGWPTSEEPRNHGVFLLYWCTSHEVVKVAEGRQKTPWYTRLVYEMVYLGGTVFASLRSSGRTPSISAQDQRRDNRAARVANASASSLTILTRRSRRSDTRPCQAGCPATRSLIPRT